MKTFLYQGLPIKYVRQGEGEPIVFIHNGGTSHAIWRDVMPKFSDRYSVYAIDLLGFGQSAKPDDGYTLDNYISLLGAFIDEQQLGATRLVGNCMGSALSLGFAMRRPESVRALVLMNPLTDKTYSGGWLRSTLWLRKNAPNVANGVFGMMGKVKLPTALKRQSLAFQLGSIGRKRGLHNDPDVCACVTTQTRSLFGVHDDLSTYAIFDEFEPGPTFPPICTIWGLENRVLSAKAGRKLNETLRPARQEWLAGSGHLPMVERPDEVASIIDEFFKQRVS
jgi:pimeloyl-ACP methyl ester carboxylesterase